MFTNPLQDNFNIQADGGANRSVSNDMILLHMSWDIPDNHMHGIDDGITCKAKGIFHMLWNDNTMLSVNMYYSYDASETFISPTSIVLSNKTIMDSWSQISHV